MVRLTHFNGKEFFVNAEMIKFVEETPDTVITLLGDDKILVKETPDEVVTRIIEYARMVRSFVKSFTE